MKRFEIQIFLEIELIVSTWYYYF